MQWFTDVTDAITALLSSNDDRILVVSVEGSVKSDPLKLIETLETSLRGTINDSRFVGLHVPTSSPLFQQLCAIYHMIPEPCLFFIRGDGQPIDIIDTWLEEKNLCIEDVVKCATFSRKENLNDQVGTSTLEQDEILSVRGKLPSYTLAQGAENNYPYGNADGKDDVETNTAPQPRLLDGSGDADAAEASSETDDRLERFIPLWGNNDQESQSVNQSNSFGNVSDDDLPDNWSLQGNQFERPSTPSISRPARVNFRLPNGESYTHEFPIRTTVIDLYNYVSENIKLPFSHWSLALVFPRRELDLQNGSDNLADLGLVPNGVVLIVPRTGEIAQEGLFRGASSMMLSLITRPLSVVYSMWSYVCSYIFRQPEHTPENPETNSQESERSEQNASPRIRIRRQARMPTTNVTRDGNIHRLTFGRNDDDDSNTWNGNSTQQM